MKKSDNHFGGKLVKDIIGIAVFSISIIVLLSVFSYDPNDATILNEARVTVYHNMIGSFGANIADLLLMSLGLSAYLVGFMGMILFFGIVMSDRFKKRWMYISGFVLLIVSLAMTISSISKATPRSSGGLLGYNINHILQSYLGKIGTTIIAVSLVLISLSMLIRKSVTGLFILILRSLFIFFKRAAKLFNDLGVKFIVWKGKVSRRKEKQEIKEKDRGIVIQAPKKKELVHQPEEKASEPVQEELFKDIAAKEFKLPSLKLLDSYDVQDIEYDTAVLQFNARTLEKKLADFNVNGKVIAIKPGPVITMYEFEPAIGVKISQIMNLSDDLALAMKVPGIRVQAHLTGKSAVGIEVPNQNRRIVYLKEVLSSRKFLDSSSVVTIGLGVDTTGEPIITDLAKMPHLLIGGSTNSGKSVTMSAVIMSFLFKATPDELKLILVDPKMLEFSAYNDIPHLMHEVITEPKKATQVLKWATYEMDRRYALLSKIGAKNLNMYNQFIHSKKIKDEELKEMPRVVIIIDELSDLMFTAPKEVEEYIIRLSQKARAAGIHLILATQRPSVDVITGTIKSNFPSRIGLKVPQKTDSRIILDQSGAEELLGAGDMLFIPPGESQIIRVHGAYVADAEVVKVTDYLKKLRKPSYEIAITESEENEVFLNDDKSDELYEKAIEIIKESSSASISLIQRRLNVGYNRAAKMVEQMEKDGIIKRGDRGNKNIVVLR